MCQLPRSQAGDVKRPRWILCTLGLLLSQGTLRLGNPPLLCKLAFCPGGRQDFSPQDCSPQTQPWVVVWTKSGQGLAFFAGTLRAQRSGPMVDCHFQESPKVLWRILIIKLAAIYWASPCSKHSAHAQYGLICTLATRWCSSMTVYT